MIFYLVIFIILYLFSRGRFTGFKSFIPHLILLIIIAFKGEVGCDFTGYLSRYNQFDPITSLQNTTGEYGWYLVEYFTYIFDLDYQTYTMAAGFIGLGFLFFAQKNIRYLGFLFFIYQMIIVQLGLSGLRQFVAVCILIYTVSLYLFSDQRSVIKFGLLIILAASFHISALSMFVILPFLFTLNKKQIFLIIIVGIIGLSSEVLTSATVKYDTRYIEGTSESAGAWVRFLVTCILGFVAIYKAPTRYRYLGIFILIFGLIIGIISSVGLHRFNYYFLPIISLLVIKNLKGGNVNRIRLNMAYMVCLFYFLFWFSLSNYAKCFIPYNFYFE